MEEENTVDHVNDVVEGKSGKVKPDEEDEPRFLGLFVATDKFYGYIKTLQGDYEFGLSQCYDEDLNMLQCNKLYSFSLTKPEVNVHKYEATKLRCVRELAPKDSILGRIDFLTTSNPSPGVFVQSGSVTAHNRRKQKFFFRHPGSQLQSGQDVFFRLRPCEENGCMAELYI